MASEIQQLVSNLSAIQIEAFFSEKPYTTQDGCDRWAESAIGESVCASFVQGVTSYTVEGHRAVVQFRTADDALNVQSTREAQIAYGPRFVPCPRESGTPFELIAYIMDNVGGCSVYIARDKLRAQEGRLLKVAIADFASFFGAPWHNRSPTMGLPDRSQLFNRYKVYLEQLQRGLPQWFRPMLGELLKELPSLFAPDWPMVPNHTDLLENNIHVDTMTGHITGICDWKDVEVTPFGMSLEGLESLLGERTTTGWRWVGKDKSRELRQTFWDALTIVLGTEEPVKRAKVARLVGIFSKFGFVWVDRENKRPLTEGDPDWSFLEAITLNVED